MKILDEALLDEFRTVGRCDVCGRSCLFREPHHIWARGMGGGGRLDVRINLLAVGQSRTYQCFCHGLIHNGAIKRDDLLLIVARREKTTPGAIRDEINRLRRLDREGREIQRKGT